MGRYVFHNNMQTAAHTECVENLATFSVSFVNLSQPWKFNFVLQCYTSICTSSQCVWLTSLFLSILKAGPSEPRVGSEKEEGEDQTDAPTHQATVSKEEESVLEKEIIDVSYFAMQSIRE